MMEITGDDVMIMIIMLKKFYSKIFKIQQNDNKVSISFLIILLLID